MLNFYRHWTTNLGRIAGHPAALSIVAIYAGLWVWFSPGTFEWNAVATALVADKAYDTDAIRADLKARGIRPVIPPKSNRIVTIRYSKRLYRQRNCIERVLGHLVP